VILGPKKAKAVREEKEEEAAVRLAAKKWGKGKWGIKICPLICYGCKEASVW
jgi:hypothetical protein